MAKLHQINVKFDPGQDRLLLRVRTDDDTEIPAWLTRRFTKLLLGVLNKVTRKDGSKGKPDATTEAMDEMKKDAALAGADFATDYRQSPASHPFGDEPVLLSGISYRQLDNGLLALSLSSPDKRSININLSRELLFVVIKLLNDGAGKAEWDLVPEAAAAKASTAGLVQSQTIH